MREDHARPPLRDLPERAAIQAECLDDEALRFLDGRIHLPGRQRDETRQKVGEQLLQAQFFRQLGLDPLQLGDVGANGHELPRFPMLVEETARWSSRPNRTSRPLRGS